MTLEQHNWWGKIQKDAHYSRRHYSYGKNITAVDIDLVETCFGLPSAIIEYKFANAEVDLIKDFSIICQMARLATGTLPVFCNFYYFYKKNEEGNLVPYQSTDDPHDLKQLAHAQHLIVAVNQKSLDLLNAKYQMMSEEQYVKFLTHKVRGLHTFAPTDTFYTKIIDVELPNIKHMEYIYA